jgi:hypothetical protein
MVQTANLTCIDQSLYDDPTANAHFIMSRTITHLSITVEDESANSHLFNMVYHSIMPFLKALRLYVLANNEQNYCGKTPEERMHNIDLPRRYPSLASVQLIVVNWPFSGTPS